MLWNISHEQDKRITKQSGWLALNSHIFLIGVPNSPVIYIFKKKNNEVIHVGFDNQGDLLKSMRNDILVGKGYLATQFKWMAVASKQHPEKFYKELCKYYFKQHGS